MTAPATILIADDDRAIRTVLNQALGRVGHDEGKERKHEAHPEEPEA